LHGFWTFIRTYVLRAGFLDGREGLLLAIANAEGSYYRYMKAWLLARRGNQAGSGAHDGTIKGWAVAGRSHSSGSRVGAYSRAPASERRDRPSSPAVDLRSTRGAGAVRAVLSEGTEPMPHPRRLRYRS